MQCSKLKTYMETGRVVFLPIGSIRPNPSQPRKVFDEGGLQELAASILQHGILQPLSVRRVGAVYELIAGERRLRGAKLAGLSEVPCILMAMDEAQSGMAALVENLQRRDLDYIEEAEGLQKLMQQYHLSQEQAARRIGKSQSAVANKLRILRHPPSVLQALRENRFADFLREVRASGESSWRCLQNVVPLGAAVHQELAVALALAEHLLEGRGACRVHGGGFAGTIQAFVPLERLPHFRAGMEAALGEGSCHVLSVRPEGCTEVRA